MTRRLHTPLAPPPHDPAAPNREEQPPRVRLALPEAEASVPPSFWRRRVVEPLRTQLVQGVTPEKLALTMALGLVLGCFPILGAATALCTAAGIALRLNQPVIQVINQAAYPLQIALLLPCYRAGEWLFQTPPVPLTLTLLRERFVEDWRQFLHDYGMVALQGIAIWCLLAPAVAIAVYFTAREAMRVLARGMKRSPSR